MTTTRTTHADAGSATRGLVAAQHVLFLVLFVVALVQTIAAGGLVPSWGLPLALALAGWYLGGILVARRRSGPAVGWTWIAGLVALWVPLAVAAPGFRWLSFALFLLAMHLLPLRAAVPAIVAMTVLVVLLQARDQPDDLAAQVVGPTIGALVAIGFAAGYQAVLRESRERARLVEELRAAHAEQERLSDELARSQRESGALGERARLAREIHDTLAQGFSSIVLLSRAQLAKRPADEAWRRVEAVAGENLTEARRVVHALAPAVLDDAPLADALRRIATQLGDDTGVATRVEVEGTPRPVATGVEVAILRVAQAALANVRSHARAERCVVTLTYEPAHLALDVVDDGIGFDPEHVPASDGGFGLRGTRERIEELGGSVSVESAPGDGTAIGVRVPTKE